MSANIETKYIVNILTITSGEQFEDKFDYLRDAIACAHELILNASETTIAAIYGDNTNEMYAAVSKHTVMFVDGTKTFATYISHDGRLNLRYAVYAENPDEGESDYSIAESMYDAMHDVDCTDYMYAGVFPYVGDAKMFVSLAQMHSDNLETFCKNHAVPFDPFHMDYVKRCAAEWRK